MKPNPTSSMQRATAGGGRSIRAPSASSTSAEPDRPVAERLPCLATVQPAPAAISAAVVETLNVRRPPPVPAVSSRSSLETFTRVASARIVRASPASSSTVSPFVRSAIRNAAIWISVALPRHDLRQHRGGVVEAEVLAGGQRVDRPREQIGIRRAHCLRARKLASSSRPCSVSTDSGWNWTPSAGSSRWRTAITISSAEALRSSSSGSSGSATSEW